MMLVGIALLVGGMAVSIGAPSDAREARVLSERGIETTATVTDVTLRSSSEYAVVDLELRDGSGSSHQAVEMIYCGEPEAISVGDEVAVIYDPEEVASPQFAECEQSQEIMIPLLIGVGAIAAGTVCVLWAWRAYGWRKPWRGIVVLVVGMVLAAASFDDDCECREFVYTGVALVVVGTVPLVARRRSASDADFPLSGGPGDPP